MTPHGPCFRRRRGPDGPSEPLQPSAIVTVDQSALLVTVLVCRATMTHRGRGWGFEPEPLCRHQLRHCRLRLAGPEEMCRRFLQPDEPAGSTTRSFKFSESTSLPSVLTVNIRITQTAPGRNPLLKAHDIANVDLMSEQASREIHESYLKSGKRLILLDNDGTLKPFMDESSWYDQWRIKRALKKLSSDPMNQVWIITDSDVGVLEKAYGHIRAPSRRL